METLDGCIFPSHPNPGRTEKIKLNFCLPASLRCLKRFYESLKRHHKEVWFLFQYDCLEMHGIGKVDMCWCFACFEMLLLKWVFSWIVPYSIYLKYLNEVVNRRCAEIKIFWKKTLPNLPNTQLTEPFHSKVGILQI